MSRKNILKVPSDFSSINAAVSAAEPGDVIRVSNGTYYEKVQITKSDLVLEAEDGATIEIDDGLFSPSDEIAGGLFVPGWVIGVLGPGLNLPPVDSYTDRVRIAGFAFRHSGKSVAAIGAHAARNCQITRNTIVTAGLGGINIHSNTFELEIDHNTISRSVDSDSAVPGSAGIAFTQLAFSPNSQWRRPSVDVSISHNRITGLRSGIILQALEGGGVKHNRCFTNTQGIQMVGLKGVDVSHNVTNDSGPDVPNPSGTGAQRAGGLLLRNVSSSVISHNESNGNVRGFFLRTDSPDRIMDGYPASDADNVDHNHLEANTEDWVFEFPRPPGIVFHHNFPEVPAM
jgi:nitrous oxidase accessory protein NosD